MYVFTYVQKSVWQPTTFCNACWLLGPTPHVLWIFDERCYSDLHTPPPLLPANTIYSITHVKLYPSFRNPPWGKLCFRKQDIKGSGWCCLLDYGCTKAICNADSKYIFFLVLFCIESRLGHSCGIFL